MITTDTFEKRIACSFNQAKVRNIRVVNNGWHLITRKIGSRQVYCFDNSGTAYLLGFFVEGKYLGDDYDQHTIVAKTLDVTTHIAQCFSNGFCSGRFPTYDANPEFENFAFNLGCRYKNLI